MTKTCFFLFLAAGIANFAFSVVILRKFAAAGLNVGFHELRWHVHRHMKTYRKMSKAGDSTLPFYGYWISLALTILFGLLTFASLAGSP